MFRIFTYIIFLRQRRQVGPPTNQPRRGILWVLDGELRVYSLLAWGSYVELKCPIRFWTILWLAKQCPAAIQSSQCHIWICPHTNLLEVPARQLSPGLLHLVSGVTDIDIDVLSLLSVNVLEKYRYWPRWVRRDCVVDGIVRWRWSSFFLEMMFAG